MRQEKLRLITEALTLASKRWLAIDEALARTEAWPPGRAERVVTELAAKFMSVEYCDEFYRWALVKVVHLALKDEEERQ